MNDLERRDLDGLAISEDGDGRTVTGRVVPYGEPDVAVSAELWERGALVDTDPTSVVLRDEHAELIGRGVSFEERADGAWMTFRTASTSRAGEVLTLIREGVLRNLSVGFQVPRGGDRHVNGVRRIRRAVLREVSTVAVPAFAGAVITEVRSSDESTEGNPVMDHDQNATPDVAQEDAAPQTAVAPVEVRQADLDGIRDDIRQIRTDLETVPRVQTTPRGMEYRTAGEMIFDLVRASRDGDTAAQERLGDSFGAIQRTQAGVEVAVGDPEARAFTTTEVGVVSDIPGLVPPANIPELLALGRQGRALANAFTNRPLPATGVTVTAPAVVQGSTVDYHTENAKVENTKVTTEEQSAAVLVLAGGQGASRFSITRSSPSYLDALLADHVAAFAAKTEVEFVTGPGTGAHVGLLNMANIQEITYTSATPTAAEFYAKVAEAAQAVYGAGRPRVWPGIIGMHSRRWGWLAGSADTAERPLFPALGPVNAQGSVGSGFAPGTVGPMGAPTISDAIPTNLGTGTDEDVVIVANAAAAWFFEDSPAPFTLALAYPDTLNVDVSVSGAQALLDRNSAAIAVISGTGLIDPFA